MDPLKNITCQNELTQFSSTEGPTATKITPVKDEENNVKLHPQPWCGQHLTAQDSITNIYNYSCQEEKEKSPMWKIAEIARYNKLRHVYDLMDESGPAHKKLFTVKLILNQNEVFEGSGSSIKKAQQAAAENAIEKTSLPLPPEKNLRRRKNEAQTPHRILQNVCRTLGIGEPVYTVIPVSPSINMFPEQIETFSHLMYSSPAVFTQFHNGMPMDISNSTHPNARNGASKGFHEAIVSIDNNVIGNGFGGSITAAKMDAASKALMLLGPSLQEQNDHVNRQLKNETLTDENEIPKYKQKSVISFVHEKAHQMKLNVVFEVLREEGPPHDRQYLVRCAFVTKNNQIAAEAEGKGKKKKEAQQEACSTLLNSFQTVVPENDPVEIATSLVRTQKKLTTLTREPKRKTIVKDKKMDPQYGHQINPVSRLIQVLQTKNLEHPTFELVGEHGQSRYKEFVMRVTCGEDSCEGSGPNKRLAKRAAAEQMLATIGYIKPLNEPAKGILKKKSIDNGDKDIMKSERSLSDCSDSISAKSRESLNEPVIEEPDLDTSDSMDGGKRRVTFNNQVHACPPPGDTNYPNPTVGPLKVDFMVEGKVRRMKRIKENRKSLTPEQKIEICEIAGKALSVLKKTSTPDEDDKCTTAMQYLEFISGKFKFGAQYTSFPKDGCKPNFSLVSLGFEDPAVCHGFGSSEQEADENAALAALEKLTLFAQPKEEKNVENAAEPLIMA